MTQNKINILYSDELTIVDRRAQEMSNDEAEATLRTLINIYTKKRIPYHIKLEIHAMRKKLTNLLTIQQNEH